MEIVHTKTQHNSYIYRVRKLHRSHDSIGEFATSLRVRDKESMQRSITKLNGIHEGWGIAKRLRWRMEECKRKQFSHEGFLHDARVRKCRCRGKMGSDEHHGELRWRMAE